MLGKPKYAGKHTVKQEGAPGAAVKECDTWKWALGLFVIPFQKITMCVRIWISGMFGSECA